jgi:outer membrane protein assembly factor BamD
MTQINKKGRFKPMFLRLLYLFLLLVIFLISSCSNNVPEGKTAAEKLFKEAEILVKNERYLIAKEKLNKIKSQYPYSFYSTHAELLLADILFLEENYVESAVAYQLFRDFHPKYENIQYVVYKMGESHFRQLPETFDRDLSPAFDAIKYFEEIKRKYPTYKSDEIQKKIQTCKDKLLNKEKYIADFYFKTEKFRSAAFRYALIVKNYQGNKIANYAKERAVRSYLLSESYTDCIKLSRNYMEETLDDKLKVKLEGFLKSCTNEYKDLLSKGGQEIEN